MFKGSLKQSDAVKVTFSCPASNGGTVAITQMWISDGTGAVPPPSVLLVNPGIQNFLVLNAKPQEAAALRVDVDLPGGGRGTLTVTQGNQVWTDELAGDASWIFDIQP